MFPVTVSILLRSKIPPSTLRTAHGRERSIRARALKYDRPRCALGSDPGWRPRMSMSPSIASALSSCGFPVTSIGPLTVWRSRPPVTSLTSMLAVAVFTQTRARAGTRPRAEPALGRDRWPPPRTFSAPVYPPPMKKVSPGPRVPPHHERVLVPAVDDNGADHVDDANRAFHSERNTALDFFLGEERRRYREDRGRGHANASSHASSRLSGEGDPLSADTFPTASRSASCSPGLGPVRYGLRRSLRRSYGGSP